MSYPAVSLTTATVGRHRRPQKRLQTAANLPSTRIRARIIAPVTPSPPLPLSSRRPSVSIGGFGLMHTMHYHIGNCWQPLEILHDHHRRQSADSSPIARVGAGPARRRPGRRLRPGVGPVRQHPARLRRPVATLQRLVRRRGPTPPCRRKPLTVARYLAARAGSGASIATPRLATSAIAKAHE